MYTKKDIVLAAFNELGLADYVYDIDPDSLNRVKLQLDSLMGSWASKGIYVGYPISNSSTLNDIDDSANLPITALDAAILALAIRAAPSFGKTVSAELKVSARQAFDAMLNDLSQILQITKPITLLAGAGNRSLGRVFIPVQASDVDSF